MSVVYAREQDLPVADYVAVLEAGLMRGKRVVVPGSANRAAALLPRLLPRGLVLWMVRAFQRKHAS